MTKGGTRMFKKKREPMLTEETDMNTRFSDFLRNFKKQKTAVVAFFVLIILMLVAIFCYKIAPYGINEYNYDEFWKEINEHNANPHNNCDSKKYIENQIKYNYPPDYICQLDIDKVKELFGIETTVNDFYNDGLRWIVFTDFS